MTANPGQSRPRQKSARIILDNPDTPSYFKGESDAPSGFPFSHLSVCGIMERTPRDVTDAELAVLQLLWQQGTATRRQITDALYPRGGPAHYTTVQKLLDRLFEKRCVRRRASGRAHVYTATVDREGIIAGRLRETAEALCEGSLTPLLRSR